MPIDYASDPSCVQLRSPGLGLLGVLVASDGKYVIKFVDEFDSEGIWSWTDADVRVVQVGKTYPKVGRNLIVYIGTDCHEVQVLKKCTPPSYFREQNSAVRIAADTHHEVEEHSSDLLGPPIPAIVHAPQAVAVQKEQEECPSDVLRSPTPAVPVPIMTDTEEDHSSDYIPPLTPDPNTPPSEFDSITDSVVRSGARVAAPDALQPPPRPPRSVYRPGLHNPPPPMEQRALLPMRPEFHSKKAARKLLAKSTHDDPQAPAGQVTSSAGVQHSPRREDKKGLADILFGSGHSDHIRVPEGATSPENCNHGTQSHPPPASGVAANTSLMMQNYLASLQTTSANGSRQIPIAVNQASLAGSHGSAYNPLGLTGMHSQASAPLSYIPLALSAQFDSPPIPKQVQFGLPPLSDVAQAPQYNFGPFYELGMMPTSPGHRRSNAQDFRP